MASKTRVVTYRLAYLDREYSLCQPCIDRDDHGRGTLGLVQHGDHLGYCQGRMHKRKECTEPRDGEG